MNSPARPYNAAETRKVDEQLKAFYDSFLAKVAESRRSTPERIDALARGRVWTGQQAKANGLVDELGGLDRAIALAKEKAGIDPASDVQIVPYPAPKTFYELLAETMSGESVAAASAEAWMKSHLTNGEIEILRAARGPATLFRRGEALALLPYTYLR
jgi:protease-4